MRVGLSGDRYQLGGWWIRRAVLRSRMLLLCRGRECGKRSGCRRGGRGEGRRVRTRAGRCRCGASRGGWFCRRCRHWGVGRRGCGCLEGRRALVTLDWLCESMTDGQLNHRRGQRGLFCNEIGFTVISDLFLHGSLAYRRYCMMTLDSRENGKFDRSSTQGV